MDIKKTTNSIKSGIQKMKNSITKLKNNSYKKYRNIKDSIDKKVGKIMFTIFNVSMMILFLLIMPILFTVMTTLLVSAGGPISLLTYKIVFYSLWILLVIIFSMRSFFKEYK